jgi:hypothetical protein
MRFRFRLFVFSSFLCPLAAVAALAGGHARAATMYPCVGAPADYIAAFDAADGTVDGAVSYPYPTVFVEHQSWWLQGQKITVATYGDAAHIHVGFCYAQGEAWPVPGGGTARVDYRIVMHHMKGGSARGFRAGMAYDQGTCPVANTCLGFTDETSTTKTALTNAMQVEDGKVYLSKTLTAINAQGGIKQERVTVDTTAPTGKRMYTTGRSCSLVQGTRGVSNTCSGYAAGGSGWYEGYGYTIAMLGSPWKASTMAQPVPASWKVTVGGSGAVGLTHSLHIDPDFHGGNPGTVLIPLTAGASGTVTIDTTTLAPGWHKLVHVVNASAISSSDSRPDGTASGVHVLPFFVGG